MPLRISPPFRRCTRLSACLALVLLCACGSGSLGRKARGNWQGMALQESPGGSEEYPLTIIIEDDEHMVIDYPSFNCTVRLVRLPSSDGHAEYREENTGDHTCDEGLVTLVMEDRDKTHLFWRWKRRNDEGGLTYATATLKRVPPSEPKDAAYFRAPAQAAQAAR